MLGGQQASGIPDDASQLKELLVSSYSTIDQLQAEKAELQDQNSELQEAKEQLQQQAELHEERIRLLLHELFAPSSEKYIADESLQARLFDEAEAGSAETPVPAQQGVRVEAHTRRKARRRPLPKDLPREVIEVDIPEGQKICGCGERKSCIGRQSSERLVVVPMRLYVRRYERLKYACHKCEGSGDEEHPAVQIADAPLQLIPKGIASAELLAFVMVSKFCDHLPFYRQAKIFGRYGIEMARSTMCGWAAEAARRCEPIVERMLAQIRAGPLIQMDETPVQVLAESGRANRSRSYMWVMRGGAPQKPAMVYRYHPSRKKDVPRLYLSGYRGHLQTDGYEGYTEIGRADGIVHVGCWAHARRKFHDAQKAGNRSGAAEEGISRINEIYRIERVLRGDLEKGRLSRSQFVERRREQVTPVREALHRWLQEKSQQVLPSSKLGEAVKFTLGQWEKLLRYLQAWYLTPDTNPVENAIRPFCQGRRNWLFSGSPRGAHASATLYSLIETAKAAGLDPYRYLYYIFSKAPLAETAEEFRKLTPLHLDEEEFKSFCASL